MWSSYAERRHRKKLRVAALVSDSQFIGFELEDILFLESDQFDQRDQNTLGHELLFSDYPTSGFTISRLGGSVLKVGDLSVFGNPTLIEA